MIEGRVRASEYDFVKQCTHLPYILFMDNLCIFGLHYHVENRTHCFWRKKNMFGGGEISVATNPARVIPHMPELSPQASFLGPPTKEETHKLSN
jgi:hypothetical protein